jgi:multiple sugar transport system permease protein/N,N'-diacetylchitobiose transport system permease protein
MKKPLSEQKFAWLVIAPACVIVFGTVLFPLLTTFIYSLKNMDLTSNQYGEFIWFQNYFELLTNKGFWLTTGRTAYFTGVSLTIEIVLGILIALLLNEDIKGKTFLRTIIVVPWAVPTIVNGAMWKWIYHPEYGALNALLTQIGLIDTYQSWLGSPWIAMNMIILADAWKMTPLVVIFLLASLQLRNLSIYEAALVDGANLFQRFYYITLPYLKSTILVIVVMRTMEAFKVFDIIYATTRGGPANGTLTLTYDAYLKAFTNLQYSQGATISYLIAFMIAILTYIYVKVMKSEGAN